MKIYIATPVNARNEATIEEKRKAAYQRILELQGKFRAIYPDAEFHSSFDDDIAPLSKPIELLPESVVMGKCVTCVMECDVILMDWGHVYSKGCGIEQFVASTYGKKIIYAKDLGIEPENIMEKFGIYPTKESQPKEEWQPCKSIDEAVAIVKANPITNDMTYEERLAAQKRRFGL